MKLQFKHQEYQNEAVKSVVDCFTGQSKNTGIKYRIDPGRAGFNRALQEQLGDGSGFKNSEISLTEHQLLHNIHAVQRRQNLPLSESLSSFYELDRKANKLKPAAASYIKQMISVSPLHLDIEMETGTGKTYCYIKSMFELNKHYGWSKFIVVVPSIAIREGVKKSFEITTEHFLESYGKRARFFIYNSKQLHELESFSSDGGINVMVINVQAFNAKGKEARRIYEELDEFQSRKPIDVIRANKPILILDEPQKMEGKKTVESLQEFNPLMILRYSATHKTSHNKIHRLDALDAYNQKLVKKIAVRGISVKGLAGTNAYLFLESIDISKDKPPVARIEIEIKQASGIKRVVRKFSRNDNLQDHSGGLDQYKGFVISDIDYTKDIVSFTNGVELSVGDATGDVNELTLRRIQIRETIRAHIEKEQILFHRGIKVLSLFFIDEVAKYRLYDENGERQEGEYARIFQEEYQAALEELMPTFADSYQKYLQDISVSDTHNGYFSVDKKTSRLVDPTVKSRGESQGEADDVDAYDLILKDKERLLSFAEPVRFIFSHSALREGWDNPNVFVICTLKHSDNTISRRQEVGRGMRLSVNQLGERMDDPAIVHDINVLTVVASESYKDFVTNLQKDISESLSERPRAASKEYFAGKVLKTAEGGELVISPQMANQIHRYLIKNEYTDDNDRITESYHNDLKEGKLADLPQELLPHAEQIISLINSVFSELHLPNIEDERKAKVNPLNDNFSKKEFQELWNKINRKAIYGVDFDSSELIEKAVKALNSELVVSSLHYTIQRGAQKDNASYADLKDGESFELHETSIDAYDASVHSAVKYDLLGKLSEETKLTRKTVAGILSKVDPDKFSQFVINPEEFIAKTSRIINEQKATVIVEHLSYDMINERHDTAIFTSEKPKDDFSKAVRAKRHVFDYVFTDSKNEREFVAELDTSTEVVVYAKLPRSFSIPTPVGDYNPDWAIAFEEGKVKHIYFVAETKGSMSSLELREIEKSKIECAKKFFKKITSEQVRYDVVDSYGKLMELVR